MAFAQNSSQTVAPTHNQHTHHRPKPTLLPLLPFRIYSMAKGKVGFMIEGWKFSLYLAMPLFASWYYNSPERQRASIDYWKYIQYPPNPNTDVRKQIAELKKQKEQREAYRQQMKELQERAKRSREAAEQEEAAEAARKRGWWSSLWSRKQTQRDS